MNLKKNDKWVKIKSADLSWIFYLKRGMIRAQGSFTHHALIPSFNPCLPLIALVTVAALVRSCGTQRQTQLVMLQPSAWGDVQSRICRLSSGFSLLWLCDYASSMSRFLCQCCFRCMSVSVQWPFWYPCPWHSEWVLDEVLWGRQQQ